MAVEHLALLGFLDHPEFSPAAQYEEGGAAYRAVDVDSRNVKAMAIAQRRQTVNSDRYSDPGHVLRFTAGAKPSYKEWRVEKRIEQKDRTFFLGPAFNGQPLDHALRRACAEGRQLGKEEGERFIQDFCLVLRSFCALEERGIALPPFIPQTIIVDPAGAVLLLPRSLMELSSISQPGGSYLSQSESLAHFLFLASLLMAPSLLLAMPLRKGDLSRDEKSPSPAMAALRTLPAALLHPGLPPSLSRLLDRRLGKKQAPVGLADWEEAALEIFSTPQSVAVPTDQISLEDRVARIKKDRNRSALRLFLKHRGIFLVIPAIMAAFVIALAAPAMVKTAKIVAKARALSPTALVQSYYQALDGMDMDYLGAAATKSASQSDNSMVTTVYITTRYRETIEDRTILLSAQEWLAEGRPELKPGMAVYGIEGLVIEEGPPPAKGKKLYTADYRLWLMASWEGGANRPMAVHFRDTLVVEPKGRGYRISSIERTELGRE